jgi:hypothetical protein
MPGNRGNQRGAARFNPRSRVGERWRLCREGQSGLLLQSALARGRAMYT